MFAIIPDRDKSFMICNLVSKNTLITSSLFLLSTITIHVCAQQQFYPSPIIKENAAFTLWLDSATKNQLELVSSLPHAQRDYVRIAFEERKEFLNSLLSNGQLMFNTDLDKEVHQVYSKIEAANPQVKNIAKVFVLTNSSVNAVNLGGGTILVCTGLLERLQNDDQLAFVLCHELAHQYKDHVNKQLMKNAEIVTDKKLNDSIQHILKDQYQVATKLTNFIIPGLTKRMQYSREKELQADSLGCVFYKKAGFDVNELINCLSMLDHADEEFLNQQLNFKAYFKNDSITFHDDWLGEEYTSSLGKFNLGKDTLIALLKTHPDIPQRISAIKKQLGADSATIKSNSPKNTFTDISIVASINDAEQQYNNHNYSRAFYIAYQLQLSHPELTYPRYLISCILGELSLYRKNHMAGKYLELQDEEDSKTYSATLNFLWALETKDFASLSYWLIRPSKPDFTNEFQMKALLYSSLAMGKQQEFTTLFAKYSPENKKSEQYLFFQSIADPKKK